MKPLIVGESYHRDVCLTVDTDSGKRLCLKVLKTSERRYEDGYVRTNLCSGKWDDEEAKRKATMLLLNAAYRTGPSTFILLGRKVALAFARALGLRVIVPFTTEYLGDVTIVTIPHPSGRCRDWNDPKSYVKARRALRAGGCLGK